MKEIKFLPVKRQVSVSGILKKLGVSRSGYNAWKKRVPSDTSVRRAVLKEKIQKIYEESHQNYGASEFLEKPSYELHDVYRALDVLGAESDLIQIEVYKNSHFLGERNDKIFYYDCSNYYFETEQEDGSKKYDKNKEHRPNPLIQMGLFMNGDGIPLAFSLFPGNANEQTSLKPLEKKDLGDFRYQNWLQMPVNSGTVMT